VIGAAGSAGLLALGVWLHERKARTDAALACVATGISGLFVSITVAAQVYSLLPQLLAVVLAIGVGAIGTALAVRWESRGIAALGILGALSAPVLGGVGGEGGTMVLLFVALASAAGVLLWQRWNWLALAAFAVATPQWISYVINGAGSLEEIAVLTAFGALGMAVAVGHEVRIRAERLHALSAYLLALNAIVVAVTGWAALGWMDNPAAGKAWLVAVALVHLGVGLAGPRLTRISSDLGLLSLAVGAVVADGPSA
jgi:Flp pilus assembly pilin Flp